MEVIVILAFFLILLFLAALSGVYQTGFLHNSLRVLGLIRVRHVLSVPDKLSYLERPPRLDVSFRQMFLQVEPNFAFLSLVFIWIGFCRNLLRFGGVPFDRGIWFTLRYGCFRSSECTCYFGTLLYHSPLRSDNGLARQTRSCGVNRPLNSAFGGEGLYGLWIKLRTLFWLWVPDRPNRLPRRRALHSLCLGGWGVGGVDVILRSRWPRVLNNFWKGRSRVGDLLCLGVVSLLWNSEL